VAVAVFSEQIDRLIAFADEYLIQGSDLLDFLRTIAARKLTVRGSYFFVSKKPSRSAIGVVGNT
jgi:hypothetical protein